MGKIKKILENELIGGTQSTDVYPVTSTKAVYDTDNKVLDDYIQHLKKTSTFAGIATPATNPGTPDGPVFYLATQAGIYTNFSGIEVANEEAAILQWNNGTWSKNVTSLATQEKLSELSSKVGVFDTVARKKGLLDVAGVLVTSAIGKTTEYIAVEPGSYYYIVSESGSTMAQVCFFDSNKNFLRAIQGTGLMQTSYGFVPTNASFLRVSSQTEEFIIRLSSKEQIVITESLERANNELAKKIPYDESQLFDINTSKIFDGYLLPNGHLVSASGFKTTGYIRIKKNVSWNFSTPDGTGFCIYDKEKKYLRGGTGNTYSYRDGDYYIRIPCSTWGINTLTVVEGDVPPLQYIPYLTSKKITEEIINYYNLSKGTYKIKCEERYNTLSWYKKTFNVGETITNVSALNYFNPMFIKQLLGKTFYFSLYVKTELNKEDVSEWSWDEIKKEGEYLIFRKKVTPYNYSPKGTFVFQPKISVTAEKITIIECEAFYEFIAEQDYIEYKSYLNMPEDSRDKCNYAMSYLHVGLSYNELTEGFGITYFNSLFDAVKALKGLGKHVLDRATILVDEEGTYDVSSDISIANDLDGTSAKGIIIDGDNIGNYVYFESANTENPDRYVIYFDGAYGLSDNYVMSTDQCMRIQLINITFGSSWKGHIKGFKLSGKNGRYIIHPETSSKGKGGNWLVENCIIDWQGCPKSNTWMGTGVGIGISAMEVGTLRKCKFTKSEEGAVWNGVLGHNNGYSDQYNSKPFVIEGAKLNFVECDFGGWNINSFYDHYPNQHTHDILTITNCKNINEAGCSGNWRAIVTASDIANDKLKY